jgi:cytochrome P450
MIPDVQRICDQLIDAFAGRGEAEFVQDFAFPLPGIVTAFERLLARLDDLRLDGEPEHHHGLLFYSFKTLPIRFRLA